MNQSEQARADTHECSACRGYGHDQELLATEGTLGACSVCNGTGLISDRTPRADAFADAETLRGVVFAKTDGDACYVYPADPERAAFGIMFHSTKTAVKARMAFRAVPGLRGEDTSGRS